MSARLDAELAARGLARSRTHAASLISDGSVRVDGRIAAKPALRVDPTSDIRIDGGDHYVSRGAHKLIAALDGFGIDVADRIALDMWASTGGFTQVLRERGARTVIAVDVGHDQLARVVAADDGVRTVEGYNVRHMTPESLAESSGIGERTTLITGDLSFISLRHVLPAAADVLPAGADCDVVLLVKPQFEVGRTGIREGIVVDPELRVAAVRDVVAAAETVGLGARGLLPSPVLGTHGNREILLHLAPGASTQDWTDEIDAAAR